MIERFKLITLVFFSCMLYSSCASAQYYYNYRPHPHFYRRMVVTERHVIRHQSPIPVQQTPNNRNIIINVTGNNNNIIIAGDGTVHNVTPSNMVNNSEHSGSYNSSEQNEWYLCFDIGSSKLKNHEYNTIDAIVNYAYRNPNARFVIKGYADKNTGTREGNNVLSKDRAYTIRQHLLNEGISSWRLSVEWYGSSVQLYGNNDMNRNVIVTVQ